MTGRNKKFLFIVLLITMVAVLAACTFNTASDNPFINKDNPGAIGNYTRDEAVDITTGSIKNLKKHLDSEIVSETGYFVNLDLDFDADDGTNFMLKFRANLFTFPYFKLDENGNVIKDENGKPLVDQEKLAIHNEVIKKNDLIIEWFDGHTNRLLLGLYFDGKNPSLNNPGNNLYLNLRGETRRMFKNFGDSVAYQQLVRLITSIDIDKILADNDTDVDSGADALGTYLKLAVSDNYKVTLNDDVTSTFYDAINFQGVSEKITEFIKGIFGPFGNKIDPLTNHYLGFKFSTLGSADIRSLIADMQFKSEPDLTTGEQVLCGADIDARGTAFAKNRIIAYDTSIAFSYSPRVQSNIKVSQYINTNEYKEFLYGQYEYKGELYVPMMEKNGMDSRMDAVVRTKLTSDVERNDENRIQMEFTDKANGSRLMLGAYYCNERTYLNTTGLQTLYGGIKLTDIGFPRAYIEGPNIAQLLTDLNNLINDIITDYVDGLIEGTGSSVLFNEILNKMSSHGDESISIRVDLELIKIILRETQEGNPEYSTQDIIDMLSDSMGYNLEEIAFMLGITDAKRMLEKTWFDLTYNVITSAIRIELSSNAMNETVNALVFRLDLNPIKIGEKVNFPEGFDGWFDGYTELKEVKTISARIAGTVKFTNAASVDISDLLGAMIGDRSGINTKYFLPASASLGYELIFDQYVKFDDYEGDVYPGDNWEGQINEMRGRIGFRLNVWLDRPGSSDKIPILNAYAKDVAFNTQTEEKDLGYVWVDIAATGFTKVKIREDVFLNSLTDYMGGNSAAGDAMALSIPQIVGALLEDSNSITFLPDVIQLSTSNKTIQKLFGVKAVLLTADIDVGLVPRVIGITSLESEFADYTVGNLANMDGEDTFSKGVYEKNLHETIEVTFELNGRTWIENLRVPYYRLEEPSSDPSDFDSTEEFTEAWRRWREYMDSPHNLIVKDGRQYYSPKTNGAFMGAERWYNVKIDRSGGSSLSAATAKVTGLFKNDLVWEPLEDKPMTILCTYSAGSINVPAEFHLDFTQVTIEGIERKLYTVTVGPSSIGQIDFQVFITIRNRRIVTEGNQQADLAVVLTDGGSRLAPVAATVSIDPYDYILWRGVNDTGFGGNKNPIGDYLAARQDKRTVTFYFADGRYERITAGTTEANGIRWQFDVGTSGMNREQFITAEGGNAIFAHAYFHNQLVALRISVQPKIFDYVMFEGETEKNTYTVDVLNSATKTINRYPTVYFKDGTSMRFPFAMQWEHPEANNVTLSGAGLIDGEESPFEGFKGKQNIAWVILSNHYNGIGSWFSNIQITINVEAPPKNMQNVYDYSQVDLTIDMAGTTVKGENYAKNFIVDGSALSGMWIVDGLNPTSRFIPAIITAQFDDGTFKRYGTDNIEWITDGGLLVKENGVYKFVKGAGTKVEYFLIKGKISKEFDLSLIVVLLPVFNAVTDKIDFYGQDGNILSGQLDGGDIITDTGNNVYHYRLDPFRPLYLPKKFRIRSTVAERNVILPGMSGGRDTYYTSYNQTPEINLAGGGDPQYEYIKQTENGRFVLLLTLKSIYQKNQIEQIKLRDDKIIDANQIANGYTFDTFTLDPDTGVVLNDGYSHLQLGAFLKQLFSATTVTVNGQSIENVRPDLSVFDRFDVQETLSTGLVMTVSFSQIPNLMDLTITVRSTGVDQITSGRIFEDIMQPYDADGNEYYPSGFALNAREFSVLYGAETILFSSTDWIVSQVVNMKSDLLNVGEKISFLSRSVIISERNDSSLNLEIGLLSYLPDGSRISRTIRITPTDANAFESAADEKFRITTDSNSVLGKYSVVIVNNMYAVRDFIYNGEALVSELPRTIKIGSAQIGDVKWIADKQLNANLLSLQFNKPGVEYQQFLLATADVSISGQTTLKLYIRFMPSKLSSVIPEGNFGDSFGIIYNQDDLLNKKTVTISIRPYQVANGLNSYMMPMRYKAKFENDKAEYSFRFNLYYKGEAFNQPLSFDYFGSTYKEGFASGDNRNKMTFQMDAGYGQMINVEVLFADQTVTKINESVSNIAFGVVDKDGIYHIDGLLSSNINETATNFVIDPYGKKYAMKSGAKVFIPTEIRINAKKEDTYNTNVSVVWDKYNVSYAGSPEFALQGTISKPGLGSQIVTIKVTVLNRTTLQGNIVFSATENDIVQVIPHNATPQIHIKNAFLFRYLRDMPSKVSSVRYESGDIRENLPVYWDMSDTDIKYNGNNQNAIMVRFRLNDENGQVFVFYVRTDDWNYDSLERKVAGQWQAMEPVYFSISEVTNQCDIDEVLVRFKVTDAYTAEIKPREQKFFTYNETLTAGQNVKNLPILYFDEDAIALAKESGAKVPGVFYLGGEDKLKLTIEKSKQQTEYISSKPSIIEGRFRYKVQNTVYNSEYILVDPLNAVYPTEMYATVNWSKEQVMLKILQDDNPFNFDAGDYLNGGVIMLRIISVALQDKNGNIVVANGVKVKISHKVNILFMDRRPIAGLTVQEGQPAPNKLQLLSRDEYNKNSYPNKNPYSESYLDAIDALNNAVRIYGSSNYVEDIVWDTEKQTSISFRCGTKAFGSTAKPNPLLTYSIIGKTGV